MMVQDLKFYHVRFCENRAGAELNMVPQRFCRSTSNPKALSPKPLNPKPPLSSRPKSPDPQNLIRKAQSRVLSLEACLQIKQGPKPPTTIFCRLGSLRGKLLLGEKPLCSDYLEFPKIRATFRGDIGVLWRVSQEE